MENQLKVLGTEHIGNIKFTGIEGGFGQGKKAMLEKDITQTQLADDLNISKNVVSEAVRGYNTPRAKKARRKIRKWLGMEESNE